MERRSGPIPRGTTPQQGADVIDPSLGDAGMLAAHLARRYGARGVNLYPLVRDSGKHLYRVERPGQAPWLLRAVPPAVSPDDGRDDATILRFLERQAYPAPRIVSALDGAPVTACAGSLVTVTTYIAGGPLDFAPASLALLGAALGRLHALPPPALPPARMLPRGEFAAAREWLAEVRDRIPAAFRARYERLEAACRAVDRLEGLPPALIHNDCHPGNSVRTPDGRVVLIDWEGAGRGPAVIDVGFLLVSCEIEAFRPNRLPPNPDRVAAVIDGYCAHHRLSRRELDCLPDAIRFRSIVACAGGFWGMVREGRPSDGADWAWARYAAADEIAARARERFEQYA